MKVDPSVSLKTLRAEYRAACDASDVIIAGSRRCKCTGHPRWQEPQFALGDARRHWRDCPPRGPRRHHPRADRRPYRALNPFARRHDVCNQHADEESRRADCTPMRARTRPVSVYVGTISLSRGGVDGLDEVRGGRDGASNLTPFVVTRLPLHSSARSVEELFDDGLRAVCNVLDDAS